MITNRLDLTALTKAVRQLEKSLDYYHSDQIQKDPELVLQLRAAAIQAFEFTYELSLKMIKRYLDMASGNVLKDREMSFPDLIRTACEYGLLLNDVAQWKEYRNERGTTSHTYDEEKAIEVFEEIPLFLKEAKYLLDKLQTLSKEL